jgi:c-di-GMP-binding flagellar brake protein YcgR
MSKKRITSQQIQPGLWERVGLIIRKDGKISEYASRIEDIRQQSFILEMPIRQSGELKLIKGDNVDITYNKTDSVYTFKASILDFFEEDGAVEIQQKSEPTRLQRRKFIRINISGKMSMRTLDDDSIKGKGLGPEIPGTLLNISAGGLLFECGTKLRENSLALLSFSLKSQHTLKNILAVIKRCEGSKNKGYLAGAEFITRDNFKEHGLEKLDQFLPPGCGTFDENLQKLVLRFIYDQQIDSKAKGQG